MAKANQNLSADGGHPKFRVDPTDGMTYEWDAERKAWFPKIDENFLAQYQAGYGEKKCPEDFANVQGPSKDTYCPVSVTDAHEEEDDPDKNNDKKKGKKRKGEAAKQAAWFDMDESNNTYVFVSNLPSDLTGEQFEEFMSKCGIIARDLETDKPKYKLYYDENGVFKGEARCGYMKIESVELALQILDGYNLNGKVVKVERAKFELKGEFDPSKKRKKLSAKERQKRKEKQEKMLDWRPESIGHKKHESVVVFKNLFTPKELEEDAGLLLDLPDILRNTCSQFGDIKRVLIFDNHPDGVGSVTFRDPSVVQDCLTMCDYKMIRGRQVRVERWDGKTNYKITETEEQKAARIARFEASLEKTAENVMETGNSSNEKTNENKEANDGGEGDHKLSESSA